MMRSSRHQSLLVMGSATPSLEAWHAMSENNNTAQTHRKIERWGKPEMKVVNSPALTCLAQYKP